MRLTTHVYNLANMLQPIKRVLRQQKYTVFAVLLLGSCSVYANDDNGNNNGNDEPYSNETCAVVEDFLKKQLANDGFKGKIAGVGVNVDSFIFITDLIDELRKATRVDQDLIYNFAKAVNGLLVPYPDGSVYLDSNYLKFKEAVEKETKQLIKISYLDSFSTNANLTRLIKCRLPSMFLNLMDIVSSRPNLNRQDKQRKFLDELQIISRKINLSRRYNLSVGVNYSYIPAFSYTSRLEVDTSTISPGITNGRSAPPTFFMDPRITRFEDEDYLSLRLSAQLKPISIDILAPGSSFDDSFTVPVQAEYIGEPSTRILYQSEIETKLYVDYDVQARLSLRDLWVTGYETFIGEDYADIYSLAFLRQLDFGIGYGVTGVSVEQNAVTDIRLAPDDGAIWNDLQSTTTVNNNQSNSFNVSFFQVYATFEINDSLSAGFEFKHYNSDRDNNSSLDADGDVLSFFVTWTML